MLSVVRWNLRPETCNKATEKNEYDFKKDRKRYLEIKRALKINSNTSNLDLERRLKEKAKKLVFS
jgi:hypothetical protein